MTRAFRRTREYIEEIRFGGVRLVVHPFRALSPVVRQCRRLMTSTLRHWLIG